jgi:hypothetical protein
MPVVVFVCIKSSVTHLPPTVGFKGCPFLGHSRPCYPKQDLMITSVIGGTPASIYRNCIIATRSPPGRGARIQPAVCVGYSYVSTGNKTRDMQRHRQDHPTGWLPECRTQVAGQERQDAAASWAWMLRLSVPQTGSSRPHRSTYGFPVCPRSVASWADWSRLESWRAGASMWLQDSVA